MSTETPVTWRVRVPRKYLWRSGSFLGITHRTSATEAATQTGCFSAYTQIVC